MTKKELLTEFYQEIWTNRNLDKLDHYLTDHTTVKNIIPNLSIEQEDHYGMIAMTLELFEEVNVTIPLTIEQDDWISAIVEFDAISAFSGDSVKTFGQIIMRYEGNKIAEAYVNIDFLALFEQLGRVPSGAHELLLSGAVLQ